MKEKLGTKAIHIPEGLVEEGRRCFTRPQFPHRWLVWFGFFKQDLMQLGEIRSSHQGKDKSEFFILLPPLPKWEKDRHGSPHPVYQSVAR